MGQVQVQWGAKRSESIDRRSTDTWTWELLCGAQQDPPGGRQYITRGAGWGTMADKGGPPSWDLVTGGWLPASHNLAPVSHFICTKGWEYIKGPFGKSDHPKS